VVFTPTDKILEKCDASSTIHTCSARNIECPAPLDITEGIPPQEYVRDLTLSNHGYNSDSSQIRIIIQQLLSFFTKKENVRTDFRPQGTSTPELSRRLANSYHRDVAFNLSAKRTFIKVVSFNLGTGGQNQIDWLSAPYEGESKQYH
jgi:hypothetical protein